MNRSKMIIMGVLLISSFMLAPVTHALAQSGSKIGFIEFQKIIDETAEGQKVKKQLEDTKTEYKIKLEEKKLDFMKETQNFKKQADMYTGETLEKKKRELAGMQYDLQKMEYEYNMELEKMKVELLKGLVANLKEVIQQIGKEQRYGMILLNDEDPMIESGFIMYGDPQNDLTAVAAKMLNERFKNAPKTDGKKEGKGKSK